MKSSFQTRIVGEGALTIFSHVFATEGDFWQLNLDSLDVKTIRFLSRAVEYSLYCTRLLHLIILLVVLYVISIHFITVKFIDSTTVFLL